VKNCRSGVLNVTSFVSLSGYKSQSVALTLILYCVAQSHDSFGTNSITFHHVHLHFHSSLGVISIGQGNASLFSRLVNGIIGILKKTIAFLEILSRVFSGIILVTFAHEIASKIIV
jgi:hypothetical protein